MLTGVSAETIRHWRRAIPYLAARPGKSARFTFTDVVGLATVREVISTFGVRITDVSLGVNALFQLLADARPAVLKDTVAVITVEGGALLPAADLYASCFSCAAVVIPIGSLIDRLRQAALPFPPRIVRSGT